MSSVADHVKGTCTFSHYREGFLYYTTDDTHLTFPVPVSDVQGASCHCKEKSVFFMRWIRPFVMSKQMPGAGNSDSYYH